MPVAVEEGGVAAAIIPGNDTDKDTLHVLPSMF